MKVTILDHQNGSRKKNVKANKWKFTPKTPATLDQLHNILKFHHTILCIKIAGKYTICLFNSSSWKDPPILQFAKPSISMGSHNQRVDLQLKIHQLSWFRSIAARGTPWAPWWSHDGKIEPARFCFMGKSPWFHDGYALAMDGYGFFFSIENSLQTIKP